MASKYWIKLYHEILDDPKMGRLPDNLWRRVIELFLIAGDADGEGELPPINDISWRLRVDSNQLMREMEELQTAGILSCVDDQWIVTNFAKRQAAETSTERWRRWRDRQRKEKYYQTEEQQESNTEQTDDQRISNETQTIRLTDIDKDKEEEKERAHARVRELPPKKDFPPLSDTKPDRMIAALAAVTEMDLEIPAIREKIENVAVYLVSRYEPGKVLERYGPDGEWYTCDWRGQRGELPSLASIQETIARSTLGQPRASPNGQVDDEARQAWMTVLDARARGDPDAIQGIIRTAVQKTGWVAIKEAYPGSRKESELRQRFFEEYNAQKRTLQNEEFTGDN